LRKDLGNLASEHSKSYFQVSTIPFEQLGAVARQPEGRNPAIAKPLAGKTSLEKPIGPLGHSFEAGLAAGSAAQEIVSDAPLARKASEKPFAGSVQKQRGRRCGSVVAADLGREGRAGAASAAALLHAVAAGRDSETDSDPAVKTVTSAAASECAFAFATATACSLSERRQTGASASRSDHISDAAVKTVTSAAASSRDTSSSLS
jgi:hypothetical protein